jgi:hypothetical protein
MTARQNSSWTLESELCKVAEATDISHALYILGLLSSPTMSFHLDTIENKWVRGGAETYLYSFTVKESGNKPVKALIKACVAFVPGGTLDGILQSWVERRELLASHGIIVPKLYGWGHGVIIEEFIPYSIRELLLRSIELPRTILDQLVTYAASLSKLGFAPLNHFDDLRSHGDDIVAIDFGEDLGPPSLVSVPQPRMFKMMCDYLESIGIYIPTKVMDDLNGIFAAQGGVFFH